MKDDNKNSKVMKLKKGCNDVTWYYKSEELLKSSASLPYSDVLGLEIPRPAEWPDDLTITMQGTRVPGVMALGYANTPGISRDFTSELNIAARNVYQYIRHANSGSKNYDAPDLTLMMLAMRDLIDMLFFARKAYGVARIYSTSNRYLPRAILASMGLNPDTLVSNLANVRTWINTFTAALASINIPASYKLYARTAWMSGQLFADSANLSKAQIYHFVPALWHYYDERHEQGGRLVPVPWNVSVNEARPSSEAEAINYYGLDVPNLRSWEEFTAIADHALGLILGSEDIGIMSGDILKAYGTEGTVKYTYMPEDFVIMPQYDEEVLAQIENSMAVGYTQNHFISQNPNNGMLIFEPTVLPTINNLPTHIVNSRFANPMAGDTMIYTRLRWASDPSQQLVAQTTEDGKFTGSFNAIVPYTVGSEMVLHYTVVTDPENLSMVRYAGGPIFVKDAPGVQLASFAAPDFLKAPDLPVVAAFDWHPLHPIFELYRQQDDLQATFTRAKWTGVYHDLDNYCSQVDGKTLRGINNVAFLSLFDVPAMGVANTKG